MWRERFTRRMVDRERRKKIREVELDRRRGPVHEEQDEAKILEDDEEVCQLPWDSRVQADRIDIQEIDGPSTTTRTAKRTNLIRDR